MYHCANDRLLKILREIRNEYRETIIEMEPNQLLMASKDYWLQGDIIRSLELEPLTDDLADALLQWENPLQALSLAFEIQDEIGKTGRFHKLIESEANKLLFRSQTSKRTPQNSTDPLSQRIASAQQALHKSFSNKETNEPRSF